MRNSSSLSKNINKLRNAKGWSQQQLADFAQVGLQTIFRVESKNMVPRGDNLNKIANALGTTVADLFKDSKNSKDINPNNGASNDELLGRIFRIAATLNEEELRGVLHFIDMLSSASTVSAPREKSRSS